MRQKRDYKQMMGWFIIIVMVLSVGGIIGSGFNTPEQELPYEEYNGYKIYQYGLQSQVKVADQTYTFQYSPQMLESYALPLNVLSWLSKERVYLAYKPNDTIDFNQQLQLLSFIIYQNGIIPQQACTIEEGCPDIPLIDCENDGVILLSSTENIITSDNKCLVLEAENPEEMQRLTERVIYGILGVMH